MVADYDAYLGQQRAAHLEELKDLLSIPSISTLAANRGDIARAAEWVRAAMARVGLTNTRVLATGGHPLVYGERLESPGAPTALLYGHYDVQPVDPLHLWETPPFTPTERAGRLYARGASDDKGQVFMHLKAVEALLQTEGRLPVNLKVLIEGEEEIGSPNLEPFIAAHEELLRANVLVVSDTGLYAPGIPALVYGLRGLAGLEIHLRGARGDLHSGLFGGAVENPLHVLASLLASLRHPDGSIAVAGFYDQVAPVDPAERAAIRALPFDEAEYRRELGVAHLGGEQQYSVPERTWIRPTVEVNGMWGGFQGEGTKTVLPNEAHAKLTCRLVPYQQPAQVQAVIAAHLRAHCPPTVTLEVVKRDGANPFLTPIDHWALQAAARALTAAYGRQAEFIRAGGSIPVVETFSRLLGLPAVLMGFGLETENFHAPNEHFTLENFDRGMRAICAFWHELAAARQG